MMKFLSFLLLPSLLFFIGSSYAQDEDPYLWLEEVESDSSMDWVKAQNAITTEKLTKVKGFDELQDKFASVYNDKDKIAYPTTVGDYVYNFWKDQDHVRGIWRRIDKADYAAGKENWEIVLDLDALSKAEDKNWVFHGVDWLRPEYNICLVSLSDGGTDEDEVREFDAQKKEFIENGFFLRSSKGSATWISPNELLVARNFGEGTMTTSGYPRMVKKWSRGTDIATAPLIFEAPDTVMGVWPSATYMDGKYHASIVKYASFYSHDWYYLKGDERIKMNVPSDAENQGIYKGEVILRLNSDWKEVCAECTIGSLISVELSALIEGTVHARAIYSPNDKSSISGATVTKNFILVNVMENVQSKLIKCFLKDREWTTEPIETPAFGSISLVDASKNNTEFYYTFSNFITPPTLYRSDGSSSTAVKSQKAHFDVTGLEVKYNETKSKDGTMIPYFIVHKKDLKLDGSNPTLVYAYGGFNISQRPSYKTDPGIGWIESGGVYVVACIRGGGEFGPAWHHAAMREKRQNAYDDFYSVCENLIDKKITTPEHMGAFGWSNGGLMAGVVTTQRPDLFSAVIIGAPLLDMKRFSHMLAGASWMGEYGNPDTDDWEFIKKYSPYHNVHADKKYPEVLFMTSTKDDRVHPAHARKMAAKMMEQGHPIFYYETIEGGHGASSTNDQKAFNTALMFTYLKHKLN